MCVCVCLYALLFIQGARNWHFVKELMRSVEPPAVQKVLQHALDAFEPPADRTTRRLMEVWK